MNTSAQTFTGVYSATPPAYTPDGQLNCRMLADLGEAQLQAGVSGFYLCGGSARDHLSRYEIRSILR